MSTQPQAAAMAGVIPYLVVPDAGAAIEFYKRAFAAEEVRSMPAEDGKRLMHAQLSINGGTLMLNDPFPEHGVDWAEPRGVSLQLVVDDAQAWWDRAVKGGCEIVSPMRVEFWGDFFGVLKDPYANTWQIAGPADVK